MPWHVAGGDEWLSWAEVQAYREVLSDIIRERSAVTSKGRVRRA